MRLNRWIFTISTLLSLIPFLCEGQLKEYPIANSDRKVKKTSLRTAQEALQLPFWDDFYLAEGVPDDSLWDASEDVLINEHYAYLPPTLGVATFDGLTFDGTPYNTDPTSTERTDRLTSHVIDLSTYSASDGVVLSFFYQLGGYGEAPDYDDDDKLQVEFKNADGNWLPVREILPAIDMNKQAFQQVFLKIEDPSYFHENFQFAFQTFGNQAGPYDLWHIDYVYLNANRTVDDGFYPDRAINHHLSNIFKNYSAIPRQHIDMEEDLKVPFYLLNNLYDNFQTYRQSVTIFVKQTEGTTILEYPLTAEGTNSPIFRDEIDSIHVPFAIETNEFPEPDSSIREIEYEISVKTFDNRLDSGNYDLKYAPIDFRVNDTLRKSSPVDDYYAYDDGTAEAAAGLQQSGNKLAYQFFLMNVDSSFIHGVDINTIYAGESANGKSIELQVWRSENGKPGEVLAKETIRINGSDLRNEFSRYIFRNPVLVKDTFYIGFTLTNSGILPIGLDKNSNFSDKIMENVNGEWFPIGDRITGTLMMRPFVGPAPNDPVTAIDKNYPGELEKPEIKVYPNPSTNGIFYLQGNISAIEVMNISGQKVNVGYQAIDPLQGRIYIKEKGIFIIKIATSDQVVYKKIIVK